MPGMPGWVGRTLGKASVELLLARDESGEVYLGRHRGLQCAVALMIFDGLPADDAFAFATFQCDAVNLSTLKNPRIAAVLESSRADGYAYLVLEYVPGTSLASHLKALSATQRILDAEKISRILNDAFEGKIFSHKRGVIHRALRPSSILLPKPLHRLKPESPIHTTCTLCLRILPCRDRLMRGWRV